MNYIKQSFAEVYIHKIMTRILFLSPNIKQYSNFSIYLSKLLFGIKQIIPYITFKKFT